MLWNEAGQQTKQVVTCPCADPIDSLLFAPAILEGTAGQQTLVRKRLLNVLPMRLQANNIYLEHIHNSCMKSDANK